MKNKTLAFIGAVGVPNNYGGFEMFLESCAPEMVKSFERVLITCDSSRYTDHSTEWQGVERMFVPIPANGASSIRHDLAAFVKVFGRADAIVVLGVSAGIFFPFFRLASSLTGRKLVVNVDGVEWRRAKFSMWKRTFLYISDRLAQLCAHQIIVDNEALRPYLVAPVRKSAALIAYSGDHVERRPELADTRPVEPNLLTICRIEPENNCHLLIEAFAEARCGSYVFIGNWNASAYGREIRAKYAGVPGLEMRDPVYDKDTLSGLRETCNLYLHGHSVGGTNPSLVEMLFYDCNILAFDCTFNRATADHAISYFTDARDLSRKIAAFVPSTDHGRKAVRAQYTRKRISSRYTGLIAALFNGSAVPHSHELDVLQSSDSRELSQAESNN